jgi:hypothetical protein
MAVYLAGVDQPIRALKNINVELHRTDLVAKFRMYSSVERQTDAAQLMRMYGDLYLKPMPDD